MGGMILTPGREMIKLKGNHMLSNEEIELAIKQRREEALNHLDQDVIDLHVKDLYSSYSAYVGLDTWNNVIISSHNNGYDERSESSSVVSLRKVDAVNFFFNGRHDEEGFHCLQLVYGSSIKDFTIRIREKEAKLLQLAILEILEE
ncbi:hypothetical protein TH2_082 [Shewanella phage Thanatos-2]|nr:hypothetical protein TH2_082 [Shewanella phage Thanatos-2]